MARRRFTSPLFCSFCTARRKNSLIGITARSFCASTRTTARNVKQCSASCAKLSAWIPKNIFVRLALGLRTLPRLLLQRLNDKARGEETEQRRKAVVAEKILVGMIAAFHGILKEPRKPNSGAESKVEAAKTEGVPVPPHPG